MGTFVKITEAVPRIHQIPTIHQFQSLFREGSPLLGVLSTYRIGPWALGVRTLTDGRDRFAVGGLLLGGVPDVPVSFDPFDHDTATPATLHATSVSAFLGIVIQ